MNEFMTLDLKGPATIEAVLEAVVKLSEYDEAQVLELVSAGKLREIVPFRAATSSEVAPDFVSEEELVQASAFPLATEDRRTLIQSSMPRSEAKGRKASTYASRKRLTPSSKG